MKLLIVFPGLKIKEYLNNRADIVYLDSKGWWIKADEHSERYLVNIYSNPPKISDTNHVEITKKLRYLGPIWARWVAKADQYEIFLREALIYILHLKAGLENLGVTKAIFHTMVSHHIDSSLIEIACSETKIPQVFLYPTIIPHRLLPLIQSNTIADRMPLRVKVSQYNAADDIKAFIKNKLQGKAPATNTYYTKYHKNAIRAVIRISYTSMLQFAVRVKGLMNGNMNGNTDNFFDEFPPLNLPDHLRLIANQRKGLDFYDRNCVGETDIEKLKKTAKGSPLCLIAAHYQPEATSFPEGGALNNHVDVVIALRSLGYDGPIIYKEHPSSYAYLDPVIGPTRVGIYRSVLYYKRLLSLGCTFVRPEMNLSLNEAENYWYIPVTMTGSIGVERSLAGFNTICTGYPWYKGMPGAVPVAQASNLLKDGSGAVASKEIAVGAFDFLNEMLLNTTIINATGIATGIPINDNDTLTTFMREFDNLIDSLMILS